MTNSSAFRNYTLPYQPAPEFQRPTAYFCMEFGIDQALKIYSGGLGYLAGSHMRSAYDLKQNLIGIGIRWKNGYYDQVRKETGEMGVLFRERRYNFLEDTGIVFDISIHNHPVKVKAWYLPPDTFGSAPIFLLSTDLPENDYLAQTISHRLYDNNPEAKVAQYILLGLGGARLLEEIGWNPDVYHFNEAHALPAAFHLYHKLGSVEAVKEKVVFTTHTPVEAGNEKHDFQLLNKLGFFGELSMDEALRITHMRSEGVFNQTLAALRLARVANGVSAMHGEVARDMWGSYDHICPITHITNSQNHHYWHDELLDQALENKDAQALAQRKRQLRKELFKIVSDQTGKVFNPDVCTLVWARRFAQYKRADLITRDLERFEALLRNTEHPIQIIWAGKPYPMDYGAIDMFNHLVHLTRQYPNTAVLTGYELSLSKALKQGSDLWLNNPRIPREASGTSGMTAAMNASVNLSTLDGWIPEFAQHGHNAFVVPTVDQSLSYEQQDELDRIGLLEVLEQEILPCFYERPEQWWSIVQNSMREVSPAFDSDRMARDYYEKLYQTAAVASAM
jgi:starch phosphorylase